MNMRGQMMNIAERTPHDLNKADGLVHAYRLGHRDARHQAAELALKADACIDALRELDKRLTACAATPASAADAYDSFYRDMVADALAAVGAA